MKTLYKHLHHENLIGDYVLDHKKADEMCLSFQMTALKEFKYPIETRRTLYRFAILIMHYLDSECPKDDFEIESFFKLLRCEVKDESFKSDCDTVFDVVVSDALDNNMLIYTLYNHYKTAVEHMPDDAYDFYLRAWDVYTAEHDIEFNSNAIHKLWSELQRKSEEEQTVEIEEDEDEELYDQLEEYRMATVLTAKFFSAYDLYRRSGEQIHYLNAKEAIRKMPQSNFEEREIVSHTTHLLFELKQHGDILRLLDKNYTRN